MKKLIAVLVLVSGTASAAEFEFQYSKGVVRLSDKACSSAKVAPKIKPEYIGQFRAGVIVWEGVALELCWTVDPTDQTKVFVIDETGDRGSLPMGAFKKRGVDV